MRPVHEPISHPSDTIRDVMHERGWGFDELVERMGLPRHVVTYLLDHRCRWIELHEAEALADGVGGTPGFWLRRWAIYERRARPHSWWEAGSPRVWNGGRTVRGRIVERVLRLWHRVVVGR